MKSGTVTLDFSEAVITQPVLPIEAEVGSGVLTLVTKPGIVVDMDEVVGQAIRRVENAGIVFLDELDKVAGREGGHGPDVSREGVQRDLLPIVEGSAVTTKYGIVRTDHVLFIAAGAFHVAKPADLIPELQGRFPIRVELEPLTREDFVRILTEPRNALIRQYVELLRTAPHTHIISRPDEVKAAKEPVLRWTPKE